jgi:hypothetical protein
MISRPCCIRAAQTDGLLPLAIRMPVMIILTARADATPHLGQLEFPIMPCPVPVRYECKRGGKHISFNQLQVPLVPAFALTAHKAQGQTTDTTLLPAMEPRRHTSCKLNDSCKVVMLNPGKFSLQTWCRESAP